MAKNIKSLYERVFLLLCFPTLHTSNNNETDAFISIIVFKGCCYSIHLQFLSCLWFWTHTLEFFFVTSSTYVFLCCCCVVRYFAKFSHWLGRRAGQRHVYNNIMNNRMKKNTEYSRSRKQVSNVERRVIQCSSFFYLLLAIQQVLPIMI